MSKRENWRPIEGYPHYMVSSLGRVKSLEREVVSFNHLGTRMVRTLSERILVPKVKSTGYLEVNLFKSKKSNTLRVNRLVAKAFVPNPKKLPIVLHKDDDLDNNSKGNLRWGTHQDNMDDMTSKGRQSRQGSAKVLSRRDIPRIRRRLDDGETQVDIAADYGVEPKTIGRIKNGEAWVDA